MGLRIEDFSQRLAEGTKRMGVDGEMDLVGRDRRVELRDQRNHGREVEKIADAAVINEEGWSLAVKPMAVR